MSLFQAIVLGIVQGLTEFLPISSQAHLLLVPYFSNWNYQGLGFDIALHWGTLAAILSVFWKDYWNIIATATGDQKKQISSDTNNTDLSDQMRTDRKFAWYLILGTIPAAVIGFLLEGIVQTHLRSPVITIFTLSVFAVILWAANDYSSKKSISITGYPNTLINQKKSLFIGMAQAVAIIPGVSRSGVTMSAGLFAGLKREDAARYSFMLSGPIIFGAGIYAMSNLHVASDHLAAAFLAAAISGVFAIKLLLKFLSKHGFGIFVWYRLVLAAIIAVSLLYK